ncbi:CYTH domain-containing protein, partial [Mangrovicoccus algicola]
MPETELKFTLDPAVLQLLGARLDRLGPPRLHVLHSVYHDTARHRLRKAGITLRMRRDGARWFQTVKVKTRSRDGLQVAEEAETELAGGGIDPAAIPCEALRARVREVIGTRRLHPVCETRISRRVLVLPAAGGALVEIALDEGEVRAGAAAEPVRELELELKAGPLAALYQLAAELLPGGGAEPSLLSKSDRGYLLAATGSSALPGGPRGPMAAGLVPGMSLGPAAAAVFGECSSQVSANVAAVRRGTDPEGPRQLALATERLAAALEIFGKALELRDRGYLRAEARWLGRQAGAERDLPRLRAALDSKRTQRFTLA